MDSNELWQAVLGELELSLSKANFTTWFKNTFIASCREEEVIIGVPNLFTKAWLEKKYHKEIMTSLQNLTGNRTKTIVYRVENRPASPQMIPAEVMGNRPESIPDQENLQTHQPMPSAGSQSQVSGDLTVNSKYNFVNFVVGKQNELAHAAAQAVAAQPGGVYNPLFIYGGVGLGKTHLLQSIGNEMINKNPNVKVLYVTCERFTNDFINAVRGGQAREFKNRYRNVDLLLVDDIQFITGKEGTQEEFFHTFNQLYQSNRQIVITSDRPPKAIPTLESRLISRFECGMMADVGSPDFETRVAILETKCQEKGYPLANEVLHCMAMAVQSNVRELEGALNKIIAFHQFKNISPTVDTVQPIMASFKPTGTRKNVTPRQLIQTMAGYFDLEIEDLLGKSREKRLAFPRQITMFIMREEMKMSYPTIGTELGGRDHTTAMHAYEKINGCLEEDEKLRHDIELIKQRLYAL
ncbi:chromosomal replication initiator protein DnaA [Patescibacteria group bacterium]|nr:chromosomal replication initiator protein DnaA [Patescibacteria group bacterium]MBU1705491.1 chromosomal replication initiator protein DnaA [Patescibacteria group bacterium]